MAREDSKRILAQLGFNTTITFTRGNKTVSVQGLGIIHHLNFDTDGLAVNSKVARCTITESDLINQGFSTRMNGEVDLKKVIVTFADENGQVNTFDIAENFHDDTLGTITLSLQKYAPKNNS